MKINKKYDSKKNNVYLIEKDKKNVVYKKFNNANSYYQEKQWYLEFSESNINIPKLIDYNNKDTVLFIEFIKGETILDLLMKQEHNQNHHKAYEIIMQLYKWLKNFYEYNAIHKNCFVFYDLNFKNFIMKDNLLYGIDFETIRKGNKEKDLARIIAMYLLYTPVKSNFKKRVSNNLIHTITNDEEINYNKFISYIEEEIKVINSRRLIKYTI